jgi:hypothetical protein
LGPVNLLETADPYYQPTVRNTFTSGGATGSEVVTVYPVQKAQHRVITQGATVVSHEYVQTLGGSHRNQVIYCDGSASEYVHYEGFMTALM